ncbi:hypothetical protein [Halobacteriovorax sp. HLS]|uniref:hypothetical protein n=1 Tax=Halobacteriovorax sp. HLS TaxID=2234000 RepID=UPI000FD6E3F7|nr:hypothetical protein [Halobacteriovorax sp. HLS]
MKKLLILISALALFTSCDTLTGNFSALDNISLKDSKGKTVVIEQGSYLESKVKLKSKKRIRLIVEGITYEFKIPRGVKIPTDNGQINLTSAQVNQPYDIAGDIRTEVEHGDTIRDRESCTWDEPYTVCEVDANGRRVCRTQYRRRNGWKDVQFHYDIISKYLEVSFLVPGSETIVADFDGDERYYQKVYEYEGRCF